MKERDAVPGDVIQTRNGHQYLVRYNERLGKRVQFYIGNVDLQRSDTDGGGIPVISDGECELIARVVPHRQAPCRRSPTG